MSDSFVTPMDYNLPGSSGIFQARILACMCVLLLSCIQLFATPWTAADQAPLSMGILQARTLEWFAISFSSQEH